MKTAELIEELRKTQWYDPAMRHWQELLVALAEHVAAIESRDDVHTRIETGEGGGR